MLGTVCVIKVDRGFGFIKDPNGRDRFFNAKDLRNIAFRDLQQGMRVEFTPYDVQGENLPNNGLRAQEVRVIDSEGKPL